MKIASCALNGRKGHDAGRELLARLYREETGEAHPPICIGEFGKPYFETGPYHFSISHTRNYAFCVLARENVAIDAEELSRPVRLSLAEKILSPTEMARYQACENKERAFLAFWVLKEAEAKLSGKGLRLYPNHTDFSPADPRIREMHGCLVAVMTEEKEQNHAV